MTDLFPGLEQGAFEGARVTSFIADEAIEVGSPVIYVAPGTGENKPRVEPLNTQGAKAVGVVVGGDADGVYGGAGALGQAATAAGETVVVCLNGICKVKVNANTTNIAVGDKLTMAATDGIAEAAAAADEVFGRALSASTADGDYILVDVQSEGIL